jgi:hypothetical protein
MTRNQREPGIQTCNEINYIVVLSGVPATG